MSKIDKIWDSTLGKILVVVIIPWTILAIIFGITDLTISTALADIHSPVGFFGEYFGELPGYGLIGISAAIIIGGYLGDIRKQKVGAYFVIIVGLALSLIGFFLGNVENLGLIGLSISIAVALFLLFTFNKDWKIYYIIALIIGLLALFNSLIIVHVIKIVFGRVRFEDLATLADFTPWFLPQGPSFKNWSFPSGHTSLAWIPLPFLILVKEKEWKDPKKIITCIAVFGWGFFIGISRVLVGKHYSSDVLFSTGLAVIVTIVLYIVIYSNREKINALIDKKRKN